MMNINTHTSRKIERFLNGEMTPEEEKAFRDRMREDERLVRQVELEKGMLASMRRDAVGAPYNHAESRSRAVAALLASRGGLPPSSGLPTSSGKNLEGASGRGWVYRFRRLIAVLGVVLVGVTVWILYPTKTDPPSVGSPSAPRPAVQSPLLQHEPGKGSGSAPSRIDLPASPDASVPSDVRQENQQMVRRSAPRPVDHHTRDRVEGKDRREEGQPTEPTPTFRNRQGKAPVQVDEPTEPKR